MNRWHAREIYTGTTAERTALAVILSSDRYGVRFFDTDDGLEYYWDGTGWVEGSGGSTNFNQIILRPKNHAVSQAFTASNAGLVAAVAAAAITPGSIYVPAGIYVTDITIPDDTFIIGEYGRAFFTQIYGEITIGDSSADIAGLQNLYIYHYGSDAGVIGAVTLSDNLALDLYIDNCYIYGRNGGAGDGVCINILGDNADVICTNTSFRPRASAGDIYSVYKDAGASTPDVYLYSPVFVDGVITNSVTDVIVVNGIDEIEELIHNTLTLQSTGFRQSIVSKSSAYTATLKDHTILCDASGADFTVTLPLLSDAYDSEYEVGLILHIKSIDTGNVTIDGNGAETIDGAADVVLGSQYDSVMIQAGSSEWSII